MPSQFPEGRIRKFVTTIESRARILFAPELPDEPVPFSTVLNEELDHEIPASEHGNEPSLPASSSDNPLERAHKIGLVGLAFSGGGIRSATFNLGVLQGLARLEMLHSFHYLSTVSGGGYIGSWLAAWTKRERILEIEQRLSPMKSPDPEDEKLRPIHFLREYSNYLTPKLGLLSADTWSMVAIYLRNTMLNLTILIAAIAALLLVPYLLFQLAHYVLRMQDVPFLGVLGQVTGINHLMTPGTYLSAPFGVSFLLLLVACAVIAQNLRWFDRKPRDRYYTRQDWIQWLVVVPVLVAAYLGSILFWNFTTSLGPDRWPGDVWRGARDVGVMFFILLMVIQFLGGFYGSLVEQQAGRLIARHLKGVGLFVLYPTLAGLVFGCLLMWGVANVFKSWGGETFGEWQAVCWGIPMLIAVFSLVITLHIGLMGRNLPDERREWWGRLGAWSLIYGLGWSALFTIVVYGPPLVARALTATHNYLLTSSLTLGWVVTTVATALAGKSPATGGPAATASRRRSALLPLLIKVGPIIFILGLFLVLSFSLALCLFRCNNSTPPSIDLMTTNFYWTLLPEASCALPLELLLICIAIAGLLSLTVDVNEFSMHHFYENRLVRCYLGASRVGMRNPNPFTGFDENDDFPLADLARSAGYTGPYPIINATLNLVHGKELAWQERKAAAFAFTPRRAGFEVAAQDLQNGPEKSEVRPHGFRPTRRYAYRSSGINVGTAMAISGAAASPNMGSHSSPPLAFLMTLLNVRLGWWLGNPRIQSKWQESGPRFGLIYLLKDLLGLTDDRAGFVYLSDGGHFENLGIYELVRRRCRYIVACDAGEDEEMVFSDLGNAIRKCRADFGANIDIAVERIRRPQGSGRSQSHCVVGKISYPERDGKKAIEGMLVYLKSSLTGDEPADVLEYGTAHPEFPHESTADQWFDESQFESYRKLGYHIAMTTFKPADWGSQKLAKNKDAFFKALEVIWYPPSAAVASSFTKHTQAYDAIMERIRKDPELKFMDTDLFPRLSPPTSAQRRSAFYLCNSLIQLMENVYLDLNLEVDRKHPHNAGWMKIFKTWAASPIFVDAWTVSSNTYGKSFRKFCEHRLGLPYIE